MEYEIINIIKIAYDAKGSQDYNEVTKFASNVLNEKYGYTWNVMMFEGYDKFGISIVSDFLLFLHDKSKSLKIWIWKNC